MPQDSNGSLLVGIKGDFSATRPPRPALMARSVGKNAKRTELPKQGYGVACRCPQGARGRAACGKLDQQPLAHPPLPLPDPDPNLPAGALAPAAAANGAAAQPAATGCGRAPPTQGARGRAARSNVAKWRLSHSAVPSPSRSADSHMFSAAALVLCRRQRRISARCRGQKFLRFPRLSSFPGRNSPEILISTQKFCVSHFVRVTTAACSDQFIIII